MYDNILIVGDVHGNFDVIPDFIKIMELHNVAVIVAGDFGLGFETEIKEVRRLKYLSDRMKVSNSIAYAVRGNHDDPRYFNNKDEYNYDTEQVKLVSDYNVLNLNNYNVLCIGGAISIDRTMRSGYILGHGNNYWRDEAIVYKPEITKSIKNIDIVITHSAPDFCEPLIKSNLAYWFERDIQLNYDVTKERSTLTKIYNDLKKNNNLNAWYYGHFHHHFSNIINNTKFVCLNINEFEEIRLK